jgi:hypothetical protein
MRRGLRGTEDEIHHACGDRNANRGLQKKRPIFSGIVIYNENTYHRVWRRKVPVQAWPQTNEASQTLKVTAGVTDRLWEMKDLIETLEAFEMSQKRAA